MNFKIKEARQIANISQKELAKVLGIAPATLSGYESGAHDPKSDILTKIADICGVSVDFLLGREFVQLTSPDNPSEDETSIKKTEQLLLLFHRLNHDGQDRLLETADDMVSSGKYEAQQS